MNFSRIVEKAIKTAVVAVIIITNSIVVSAADYNVGPGQPIASLAGVNWSSLQGGDTVYIHYATYNEKFNITSRGTAQNPIRVIGVLDANGNRPVIDGQNATTPASSDFRWQDNTGSSAIQFLGVVFVTPGAGENPVLPGYIEIKNLEIRNGYVNSSFTGENGSSANYNGFAAGIYLRSAQNVLIENCVIHNNGQGVYAWTGGGNNWWDGLARDITLRGNHFYNNGHVASYTEHQTYLEGLNTVYEYNRYGAQRAGAYGSALKDRGAGTIIRYNYFESAPSGWWIDLPEPENGWLALGFSNDAYAHAFIYGNLFVNDGNYTPNYFHWNEDHQAQGNNGTAGPNGRATMENGRLFFYNNTVVTVGNLSDFGYAASVTLFNTTFGAYECATEGTRPGVIDLRNNIIVSIPRTAGSAVPTHKLAYCDDQNFNLGKNLFTSGWISNTNGNVTGADNVINLPGSASIGFVNSAARNMHLLETSPAVVSAGGLAGEVTDNFLGLDLTPTSEYVSHLGSQLRSGSGAGSDMGAFGFGLPASPPSTPTNLDIIIN
ncbi:MAG: parallel beta-helix repeat protein [Oceanicoccus sp.]|jgi:parallel beta-helix repeat protein